MKTKRFMALVCVSLTLLTLSVSVFAFQPDLQSPFVDYGAYQYDFFNSDTTTTIVSDSCEVCGLVGYSYHIVRVNDDMFEGSISIIDVTSLNRNFNGLYNLLDDTHDISDHTDNTAFFNDGGRGYIDLFTSRLVYGADIRYTYLYIPLSLSIDSGLFDFVDDNVTSVTAHTAYSFTLVSASPVQYYIDEQNAEAIRLAYNDGVINGTRNTTALQYITECLNGVSHAIAEVLDFEIFGVSLTMLFTLVTAVAVISLIVKIIRG